MRLVYQITGVVLLSLALFLGLEASRLTYDTRMGPGPGFFPLWLCGLLGLIALVTIAQATFGKPEAMPADFFAERSGYVRIGMALLGLVATAALISMAGYLLTTFVFYAVLLAVFGRRNPIEILALAAIGSFCVHYLFSQLLGRPLPTGLFL